MRLKNFSAKEFVPSDLYHILGDQAIKLIDKKILETIVSIRQYFNRPVKINDWSYGGNLEYRGFRPLNCSVGATNSMHRVGCAIDFDVYEIPAEEVRRKIIILSSSHFPHITRMERGVSWVHIDNKPTGRTGIYLFNP